MTNTATQQFPWPEALERIINAVSYREWSFQLLEMERDPGSRGLTLDILTKGRDSYHPERGETYRVHHLFPVPPATYNEASWCRWLFDLIVKVETHEAMEFFTIVTRGNFIKRDGEKSAEHIVRPYAPNHGPGHDPYVVRELATDEDRRTSFRGIINS